MSKKGRRNRNPLLQQKFDEGYALGIEHGVQKATSFFIKKFEDLPNKKGIGPRTMEILKQELGHQYFEE